MLKVWFGHDCPFKFSTANTALVAAQFKSHDLCVEPIRTWIETVDHVVMDEDGRMEHPRFGAVNASMLSNGVCGLILAYLTEIPIDITRMGDNCVPFLQDIADKKDVTCVCNRIPRTLRDQQFYAIKQNEYYETAERFGAIMLCTKLDEMEAYLREHNKIKDDP